MPFLPHWVDLRWPKRGERAFSDNLLDLQGVLVADVDLCGTFGLVDACGVESMILCCREDERDENEADELHGVV